jgi:hypothetical protein
MYPVVWFTKLQGAQCINKGGMDGMKARYPANTDGDGKMILIM